VDVVAVLNDTTGTLLAGSYLDKHCGVGLIMGILLWVFALMTQHSVATVCMSS